MRGIRQIVNHEPSWPRNAARGDFLDQPAWQEGFARLEELGLSFDLQLNPHQFRKAARLVARHPGIPIVIGHLGSPTLEDLREGTVYWDGLAALADLEQVHIKISMLSYPDGEWDRNPLVRESVRRAMDLFGPGRCMFASNFPVEKRMGWPAARLYRAFRDLVSHLDAADRQKLFADTAGRPTGCSRKRAPGLSSGSRTLPVSGVAPNLDGAGAPPRSAAPAPRRIPSDSKAGTPRAPIPIRRDRHAIEGTRTPS